MDRDENLRKLKGILREVLLLLGEDPERDGLRTVHGLGHSDPARPLRLFRNGILIQL